MSSENTIFSICIPSYNRKDRLLKSINNILSYPGDDIEVVVNDNASTDGTWEALLQIQDKRLKCYRNEENYGGSYNYMKAFLMATGSYRMLLNDRDNVDMTAVAAFIKELPNIRADVIVSAKERGCPPEICNYEEKAYWHNKLCHPGYIIFSKNIVDKLKKKICNFDGENFVSYEYEACRMNICCQSEWYVYPYKQLLVLPSDEESITIKQYRITEGVGRNYFEPAARVKTCQIVLKNLVATGENRKASIRGIYRKDIEQLFWGYDVACNSMAICMRYDFVPPKHIFWIKEAVVFYSKVKECLKEQGDWTKDIKTFFWKKTFSEYVKFTKYRIVRAKKKVFPNAWIRDNSAKKG